jgi:hypothetical protein
MIGSMEDIRSMAENPERRLLLEKLLYLAAQRGDADLVSERLAWGIDPNCVSSRGRTPLIANVCGSCASAATVRALLQGGADPSLTDVSGLTALAYARRKLSRLQSRPARRRRKSPSLDENDQLRLSAAEQAELDRMRDERADADRDLLRIWWRERLRAARRVFNDPGEVAEIVEILEARSSGQ